MKLEQMGLVTAMMREASRQAKARGEPDLADTFQLKALVKGANVAVAEFNRARRDATPGGGLEAWLECDEAGQSARFMAHVLAGGPAAENNHPHDPGDFNRCVKFLKAVPLARGKLALMKGHGQVWERLVDNWAAFEELLNQASGKSGRDELYEAMKEIGC